MKNDEKPLEPTVEEMPIAQKILVIQDKQVMLDRDLATLYGVETKRINEQVKRNKERFPEDFCFQIDKSEFKELVANCDRFNKLKHSSSRSFAFTEQGFAERFGHEHVLLHEGGFHLGGGAEEVRRSAIRKGTWCPKIGHQVRSLKDAYRQYIKNIYHFNKNNIFDIMNP